MKDRARCTSLAGMWAEIERLHKANARHVRSGMGLKDMAGGRILDHLESEVKELKRSPEDIEELADVLAIAVHYAVRCGWKPGQVVQAVMKKLAERIEG
jgi:predicted house-cleaning noncanonical NTP pyrophosphatase (MazG superfamily)